jgi:hypothetical protein
VRIAFGHRDDLAHLRLNAIDTWASVVYENTNLSIEFSVFPGVTEYAYAQYIFAFLKALEASISEGRQFWFAKEFQLSAADFVSELVGDLCHQFHHRTHPIERTLRE